MNTIAYRSKCHRSRQQAGGYTLIELLVAMSIFALVMLGATATYLSLISYNRQVQTTATIMNSLSFAIDSMARDIRTGTGYTCAGGCAAGGVTQLSFTDANNCVVTYGLVSGAIVRSVASGSGCTVQTNIPVTDPAITVSTLRFYVRGASSADTIQPMATIVISGSALSPNSTVPIPFQIQTGATQRLPDL